MVAHRVEVPEHHRVHRATEADRQRVHRVAAGDLPRDVDRGERAEAQVVVEGEIGHRRVGIAVADREGGVAVAHRPLDQALARREVGDVVAVDPRRAHEERDLVHLVGLRRVLQHLDELVAEDDLAARRGDGAAEPERAGVDLARPAVVAGHVAHEVGEAAQHAAAARLERPLQRRGIGEQRVGGSNGVGEEVGRELGLGAFRRVEACGLGHLHDELRGEQVRLQQTVEHQVVAPGGIGEAAVARIGLDDAGQLDPDHAGGEVGGDQPEARAEPQCGGHGAAWPHHDLAGGAEVVAREVDGIGGVEGARGDAQQLAERRLFPLVVSVIVLRRRHGSPAYLLTNSSTRDFGPTSPTCHASDHRA